MQKNVGWAEQREAQQSWLNKRLILRSCSLFLKLGFLQIFKFNLFFDVGLRGAQPNLRTKFCVLGGGACSVTENN